MRAMTVRRSSVSRQREISPRFSSRSSRRVTSGSRVIMRLPISPQGSPAGEQRRMRSTLYCVADTSTAFRMRTRPRDSMSVVRSRSRNAASSREPTRRLPFLVSTLRSMPRRYYMLQRLLSRQRYLHYLHSIKTVCCGGGVHSMMSSVPRWTEMNSCESPRPRLLRFFDLPDQGFMVVPLPTVRPTTSSMEPASTAIVESASTTVESAATAPCATQHGAGMETPSSRSRSVIDAVGITAPGYIVRAVPPVTGICTEVMVIVTISASVPAVPISVPEERSLIDPKRGIETPAERAIENPVAWNEGESVKPGVPRPIGSPPARTAPSVHSVHASRIYVGFGQIARPQTTPAKQIAFLIRLLVEFPRLRKIVTGKCNFAAAFHIDMFTAALHERLAVEYAQLSLIPVKVIQPGL